MVLPNGWLSSIVSIERLKDIAKHAEDLGFDALYAYDHLLPYNRYSSLEEPILECWTLLSSLISVTSKIKLGQVVLCNSYRSPALLAKMASTLDYLSNGRLELGIGAGWYEEEYTRFGYKFPTIKNRLEQLDEALYIIRELLTNAKVEFNGKYYKVNTICKPVPKHKPRIMVGGSSNMLLKIASRYADIYNNPFGDPEEVSKKIAKLSEYCYEIGRKDIAISVLLKAMIGDEKSVYAIASRLKSDDESIKDYLARSKNNTLMNDNAVELLNRYRDVGVKHFIIHLFNLENDLTLMDMLKDMIASS